MERGLSLYLESILFDVQVQPVFVERGSRFIFVMFMFEVQDVRMA